MVFEPLSILVIFTLPFRSRYARLSMLGFCSGNVMIRFSCPRCKSSLEQPESTTAARWRVPSAAQRLQVPLPPTSKTILGDLVVKGPVGAVEIKFLRTEA